MTTIQALRKDYKAFNKRQIVYDVYCDRVNFVGFDNGFLLDNFFRNRNTIVDPDRAGYSISRKDAERLGIPTEKESYIICCKDLRKKGF